MRNAGNPVRHLLSPIFVLGVLIGALALAPVRPSGAEAVAPTWSYTGSTTWGHPGGYTATLLPDGKVLVDGPEPELYDPSTGTWRVNGARKVPRSECTATLLGNGKVLFAGGIDWTYDEPQLTNTAELYDPATGESRFTGDLNLRRFVHTATLLPNGKVLFAGGVTYKIVGDRIEGFATNTAELYDPATGQWSLTGNLSTARVYHAAALLQNGKVLVAGGGRCLEGYCQGYTASADVYDPDTDTWSSTGSLNTPRGSHTLTTLPNGNVVASGGEGNVFPFQLDSAEIYNPATERWSASGSLNTARVHHTATLLSTGQVLVVGGHGRPAVSKVSISAELYDPATDTWSATASLNTDRYLHTATLLKNGKVLVVGGPGDLGKSEGSTLVELYSAIGSEKVVTVSAASYHLTGLASQAIATSFGTGLATATIAATTLPLPTEIGGTSVKVKDTAGTERFAPLLYVSPTQVNYQIPAGTALGAATVTITSEGGSVSSGIVLIKPVAPSLFTANGDGQGVAAAVALRVKADGSRSYEEVVQFDAAQNRFIPRPIDLGPESDQVYLSLFGTVIRNRSSLSAVITTIGGAYAAVSFAGVQPYFEGLDQVNVLVPRSLIGRGEVDVLLTVEAQMANPVRIQIK